MKTLEERALKTFPPCDQEAEVYRRKRRLGYIKGATEQREHDIKALSKVYADLLSAKGYDIGTINSELARLHKEIKEE